MGGHGRSSLTGQMPEALLLLQPKYAQVRQAFGFLKFVVVQSGRAVVDWWWGQLCCKSWAPAGGTAAAAAQVCTGEATAWFLGWGGVVVDGWWRQQQLDRADAGSVAAAAAQVCTTELICWMRMHNC
jgi:hypothetical protein